MQQTPLPILETRVIDDNSSWSSMSDTEKPAEEPKPAPKLVVQSIPAIIETEEERMVRFKIKEADLNALYCVGSIHSISQNDIVVHPGKELLNLDNILFIKINDKPIVLGEVDDVFGSIENPLYAVKLDDFLRQVRPYLEQGEQGEIKVYVNKQNAMFLDKDEIQSMRMEKGTDACFQTERDFDSSGDESEYRFNQSQHNEYFSKRNKSPFDQRDFQKRVKSNPYVADDQHQNRFHDVYRQQQPQFNPGGMLLNYLQPQRYQAPDYNMAFGGMTYPEPNYPSAHVNRQIPPHMMNQQQIPQNLHNPIHPINPAYHQNPQSLQHPANMHYPQYPQNPQNPQNSQQALNQLQQPNSNPYNSFFYQ